MALMSSQELKKYAKRNPTAYGGRLLCTRAGRARPRPLHARNSMHLVLRSTRASGPWSFKHAKNKAAIQAILAKFSQKHGVQIWSQAIAHNHLHLHIKLRDFSGYKAFIRAVSAAIAMAVTGICRWRPNSIGKFWNYRPFTRIIQTAGQYRNVIEYISLNQLEACGLKRAEARLVLARRWSVLNTS